MVLSLPQDELFQYVQAQLEHLFPDRYAFRGNDVDFSFRRALNRMENCIAVISHPGYHDIHGNATFSHLHADQYAQFLYFLGNTLWMESENKPLCDKLLQLNRVLFSVFISYKCLLPDHFFLGHPIGTILGNADYHDFLVVSQGVTVNTGRDEAGSIAPVLGKGLFLGAHSKIIGNKSIGDRVSIGVDAMVYQRDIPDDSVVICEGANRCVVRSRKRETCRAQGYFNVPI